MKSDLDNLMETYHLDAILITGAGKHNPAMVYLTGGAFLTHADVVKKHGAEAILFHASMERDEAARSGLVVKNTDDFKFQDLLKNTGGDLVETNVLVTMKMLESAGVTEGRLAVYGQVDAGRSYAILSGLQRKMPGLEIVGEMRDSMLLEAMATKDEDEIRRIRQMGRVTTEVVALVADFLTSHRVKDETLYKSDDTPLTIGDVKKRINGWLTERGAEDPEGVIFAIGYDSAVPHSTGTVSDRLQLGQTIIFDIFPCEAGGGYFYDFTRTWCLGYAPEPVLALYEDVSSVYQQIMGDLRLNAPCKPYQQQTCELFEAKGHPTIQSVPETQKGYVHSLGHGVGLHVHERPWFSITAKDADRLAPGVVVAIEPGLYYPDRKIGVRLEDTVWMRPDGQAEVLAPYPHDLVLPIKRPA